MGVDLAFLPDSFGLQSEGRHAVRGRLEAVATAARLSAVTSRIGLIPTATVTHTEPFHISKAVASIDYSSAGRAGWQVAVSDTAEQAALFGRKTVQGPESAWEEASEAVEVVSRLWDSWEDDAEIRDAASGRFIDRDKLHYIDFEGKNFSVKGPSITPRSPQGQPLIAVDASRPEARELAVARGDLIRISQPISPRPKLRPSWSTRVPPPSGAACGFSSTSTCSSAPIAVPPTTLWRNSRNGRERRMPPHSLFYRGDSAGLTALLREIGGLAGIDGVVLRPLALAAAVEKIATDVVPTLNPRPSTAPTLRERLGFQLPVNQFA